MYIDPDLTITLGALLTFTIWSYAFKESPISRFGEFLYIGAFSGYQFIIRLGMLNDMVFTKVSAGDFLPLIPLLIGFLFFARFAPKYKFLEKWPIALIIGTTTGLLVRGTITSEIINQIKATTMALTGDAMSVFNGIVLLVCMLSTMSYLIYTRKRVGVLKWSVTFSKHIMMLVFAGVMAGTFMQRISYFIERSFYLLSEWLHIV